MDYFCQLASETIERVLQILLIRVEILRHCVVCLVVY